MRRIGLKKILLIAWACALAFGFTFQSAEASALHRATCGSQCSTACKSHGGCGGYMGNACSCDWICGDGSESGSICVL